MEMPRKHAEEHENDERWLLTYSDLITLLMVFFVVMYSMSQTDAKKFKALATALQGVFGSPSSSSALEGGGQGIGSQNRGGTSAPGSSRRQRMERLRGSLEALVAQEGMGNAVHFQAGPDDSKLVMQLSDSLMFPVGSADLTEDAKKLLRPMGDVLSKSGHLIHVEGHTDNLPITNVRYTSNFELSSARAAQVIQYLIEVDKLPPERFSASGYAEYRPVADNSTAEGRARNRRVDFVIYDEGVTDPIGSAEVPPAPAPAAGEQAPDVPSVERSATAPIADTPSEPAMAPPAPVSP